jgi:hypothetical protein
MQHIIDLELPTDLGSQKLAERCKAHLELLPILPGNLSESNLEDLYNIQTSEVTKKYIERNLCSKYSDQLFGNDIAKLKSYVFSCRLVIETGLPHIALKKKIWDQHFSVIGICSLLPIYRSLLEATDNGPYQWIIGEYLNPHLISKMNENLTISNMRDIDNVIYFQDDKRSKEYKDKLSLLFKDFYSVVQ